MHCVSVFWGAQGGADGDELGADRGTAARRVWPPSLPEALLWSCQPPGDRAGPGRCSPVCHGGLMRGPPDCVTSAPGCSSPPGGAGSAAWSAPAPEAPAPRRRRGTPFQEQRVPNRGTAWIHHRRRAWSEGLGPVPATQARGARTLESSQADSPLGPAGPVVSVTCWAPPGSAALPGLCGEAGRASSLCGPQPRRRCRPRCAVWLRGPAAPAQAPGARPLHGSRPAWPGTEEAQAPRARGQPALRGPRSPCW